MNCPFNKNHSRKLPRLLSIVLAVLLLVSVFSGCQKSESPVKDTDPAAPPSLLEIPESESSAPDASEAPSETTAAPEKKNAAIVKEQANVRSSPSMESNIIGQLDAGDEVEINRVETVAGVQWAYIPLKGWVTVENLDMTNVESAGGSNATPANPDATEPEETSAPNANGTTNANNANTGNGKKGIVIANGLNVRSQANTTSDIVGNLAYGTRVTILETNNGWGKTGLGWISMNYVYMDGTVGSNPCNGKVTGSGLNIRSGPGTNYETVGTLSKGDNVNILQTIKIGKTTWGCTSAGWVSMDYVNVGGTGTNNTNSGNNATASEGSGTITGTVVNVRSGAGTNFDIVGTVSKGDTVNIISTKTVDNVVWGQISNGWISMAYVEMDE